MKFNLEIKLGNEAMQTEEDVARALRQVADKLGGGEPERVGNKGIIRDENGNTVGSFQFR